MFDWILNTSLTVYFDFGFGLTLLSFLVTSIADVFKGKSSNKIDCKVLW